MRFTEFKLTETAEAMQVINRMSQQVVNYFNQNPELVRDGSKVNLDAIITDKLADPALEITRKTVQISIEPLSSFSQTENGRWQLRLPGGSMSSYLGNEPVWDQVRKDRALAKNGELPNTIDHQTARGNKTQLALPSEILTRSLEKDKATGNSSRYLQGLTADYARGIKSTIAHEINHSYNSSQGMDLGKTRTQVEKNLAQQQQLPEWLSLAANAEDQAFLNKNLRLFRDPNSPQVVKNLYMVSKELIDSRNNFYDLERTVYLNEKNKIPELEQKIARSVTPADVTSMTNYLEMMREATENMKQEAIQERANIKKLMVKQQQLKTAVAKIKLDPLKPTNYEGDAYWSSPTEVNSRLQQASLDMAAEIKPGMSNQAINELIQKTFGNNGITQEFVDPDRMHKHFAPGAQPPDRGFKDYMKNSWSKFNPDFKQDAFNSAMRTPEFKRYVTLAYKFIQAEQANPISLSKTSPATLGQKLKAALLGIPQAEIPNTILPNTQNTVISAVRQAHTPGSPQNNNLVAATVEASKKLDTPGALKALEVGGKVLIAGGIVVELYRGFDQITALPPDMPRDQYQLEVEKIVGKLVAEFGLVYVAAMAGAWASGAALSTILPGLGTVAGAVVGFIAGGAAGYMALDFAGDTVRGIAEHIVTILYKDRQAAFRKAVPSTPNVQKTVSNINTPARPNPTVKPPPVTNKQPTWENLDRIIELSGVKIGTQVPS